MPSDNRSATESPAANSRDDERAGPGEPSAWVRRFSACLRAGGQVLDLACGGGRHSRWLLDRGFRVTALDRDVSSLRDIEGRVEVIAADLEDGSPFPLRGRTFDGVVVTNYLYRPLFPALLKCLAPGGVLIYETFAAGNARFGRPANPDYLLNRGELLELVRGRLRVIAYEDLVVDRPRPAAVQRICAVHDAAEAT